MVLIGTLRKSMCFVDWDFSTAVKILEEQHFAPSAKWCYIDSSIICLTQDKQRHPFLHRVVYKIVGKDAPSTSRSFKRCCNKHTL